MSVIAVAVRHMLAAGMDADAVANAVEAMEAEIDTRSTGAKRQARYRERNKASQSVTSDAIVTSPLSPAPLLSPQTPQTTPHPHTPVSITPRAREAKPFDVCPEGVETDHWRDFLANRKAKRLPNTETAYRGVLRKLGELVNDEWPPGRLIQAIAEKGWGGIYDPRDEQEFQNGHARQSNPQYKPSAALALYQSSFEGDDADRGHDWPALPAGIGH